MKRAWKNLGCLSLCAAMLCLSGSRPVFAQAKSAPTAEEARKFIEDAEQNLYQLGLKASRAGWVQENFITDDTEALAADANEILNTASVRYAREAHRFDNLQLSPELARKR